MPIYRKLKQFFKNGRKACRVQTTDRHKKNLMCNNSRAMHSYKFESFTLSDTEDAEN